MGRAVVDAIPNMAELMQTRYPLLSKECIRDDEPPATAPALPCASSDDEDVPLEDARDALPRQGQAEGVRVIVLRGTRTPPRVCQRVA